MEVRREGDREHVQNDQDLRVSGQDQKNRRRKTAVREPARAGSRQEERT